MFAFLFIPCIDDNVNSKKAVYHKTTYTCNFLKEITYDHGHYHDETGNTTDENKTEKRFLYLLDEKIPV